MTLHVTVSSQPGHLNAKSRVSQLQTSHHARLLPLLDVEGDYERALHERFASCRVRGEWFDLTPLGDPVTVVIAALAELGLHIRSGLGIGLPEGALPRLAAERAGLTSITPAAAPGLLGRTA